MFSRITIPFKKSPLLTGTLVYFITVFITYISAMIFGSKNTCFHIFSYPNIIIGLAGLILFYFYYQNPHPPAVCSYILSFFYLLVITFFICNITWDLFSLKTYGDSSWIVRFIENKTFFPRWLGGLAVNHWVYAAISTFPPFKESITELFPLTYLKLSGLLTMLISTLYALFKWPGRLAVIFTIFMPIYLLFSSGHLEYYPYVAGPLLLTLCIFFLDTPKKINPYYAGIILASLPLLYTGFAPISLIILIWLIFLNPANFIKIASSYCAGFFVFLRLFWPGNIYSFFPELYKHMNWGETNSLYHRYKGLVSSDTSIFFKREFALDPSHLYDLFYMLFFSGGIIFLIFLILATLSYIYQHKLTWLNKQIIQKLSGGGALIFWQIYFFIFMIPKLGPRFDIDLFFTTYIVFSFFSGLLFEATFKNKLLRFCAVAIVLGNSAVTTVYLLLIGLPKI